MFSDLVGLGPGVWGNSRYQPGEGKVSGDLIVTFLMQKGGYGKDGERPVFKGLK